MRQIKESARFSDVSSVYKGIKLAIINKKLLQKINQKNKMDNAEIQGDAPMRPTKTCKQKMTECVLKSAYCLLSTFVGRRNRNDRDQRVARNVSAPRAQQL